MTGSEKSLFEAFLRKAETYLEFGSGGSTYLAASLVSKWIISVDSSKEWLTKVEEACRQAAFQVQPQLILADIGPTGDWGAPIDHKQKNAWPTYYTSVWGEPGSTLADLYLIDGRFRVSCFMSVLNRCRDDAIILVHDFTSRAHYHVIKEVAREIAQAQDLSVFTISLPRNNEKILKILDSYAFNYA